MSDGGAEFVLRTILTLFALLHQNLLIFCAAQNQRRRIHNYTRSILLTPPPRAPGRRRRRFWVRPGAGTRSWWDTLVCRDVVDDEWRAKFRMSRASLVALSEQLRPHIEGQSTTMREAVDTLKKVAFTLFHLSDGGRLRKTATAFGLSRQAVSVIMRHTCKAIALQLGPKYVRLPFTEPEVEELVSGFRSAHGIPQCLGAIDGTHVEVKQPSANAMDYVNTRGTHSLNIQAVCDHRERFMDVIVKWPGTAHDARVFRNSKLHSYFRSGKIPALRRRIVDGEEPVPVFLVGDSAYPLLPFLMTEYPRGGATPQEQEFGSCLRRSRGVIERAIGRLKTRFPVLKRPMDINLNDLPHVIYACFVLHNYCEERGETVDEHSVLSTIHRDQQVQPPTEKCPADCEAEKCPAHCEAEGQRVRRVLTNFLNS